MSLLDDVSIVVTPNGYKAGTLYGVLPTYAEGSEIIQNVDFSSDTWWLKSSANVNISNGKGNYTAGTTEYFYKPNILTVGKIYKLVYEITDYTTGYISALAGNWSEIQTVVGTYEIYFTCIDDDFGLVGNTFVGSIDNVTVKEVTSSDMDVTRATAATRVDENGLVNYAEVLGSELVTSWTNNDFASFASSGSNITQMVSSGSGNNNYSAVTITSGKIYKLKFTSSQAITCQIRISANTNLTGASVILNSLASGTNEVYFTASSNYAYIGFYAPSSFTDTQISNFTLKEADRNNVPRIDYTGGGCPHILAEPQRTNLITYSEDFSNAYWTKSNVTVTPNTTTSPDGTTNADSIILSSGTSTKQIYSTAFTAITTNYSYSGFFKKNTHNVIQLLAGNTDIVNFDLNLGTFNSPSSTSAKIENFGNGWYRCTMLASGASSSIVLVNVLAVDSLTSVRAESTSSTGTFYAWGVQVETGTYPTSYIPTSGSTVTRNQDLFTRDGIASLINSTAGVFFIEMATFLDEGTTADKWIALSDGTANNSVRIAYSGGANTIRAYLNVGGSAQADMTYAVTNVTQFSKIAFSYAANNFNLWVDGVKRVTDTSGNVFSANTLNRLGLDNGGGGSFPGKIKQLQVYKTALTDTQLAALTS